MSFGIIIRGKNQPSKSKHFRPHYNTSMGKYYSTKDDFHKDLKDKGMEMYDERTVKKPETKKYTPSGS